MRKYHTLICIISFFTVATTRKDYEKLPEKVKEDMKNRWEACCQLNTCVKNSCFIIHWFPSTWSIVRQRCQGLYPDWPYNVDIFRIQNESDVTTFWTMLQDSTSPIKRENPGALWTSGSRCPVASDDGTKLETRWASTNEQFPDWLEKKVSSPHHAKFMHMNGCEFLAITLSPRATDVKYDFQDQKAHHSAICEFSVPGLEWTVKPEDTTQTTKLSTSKPTTLKEIEESVSIVTTAKTTETTTSSDATFSTSSETIMESAASASSPPPTQPHEITNWISMITTKIPRQCKAVNKSGIYWPDTPVGETRTVDCPKGMTGSAKWKCNENLQFWPEKPQTEGCKHEWIEHIEDSILKRDDAVDISSRLSRETKHNNMSHGDIIALVNLTERLFHLYVEQKSEEEFEVSESEEVPVYFNFTKTMISSISNILREEIKDAWAELNETRQTKEASTILKLVTTIGSRLSCMKISSEKKLQFSISVKNIDLQTFILNNSRKIDDVVRFPQETEDVQANSFITLPGNLKLERWYSPCKNYRAAVGVIYKHVGDFLKAGQQENTTTRIATKVLSFSLSNSTQSISLSEGKVYITLGHLKTEERPDKEFDNARCVFWNFSKSEFGEWDTSGCSLLSSNKTHTECQCEHLTNFAVLWDINHVIKDDHILTWMTYVCCGFSSVSLFLTLICFVVIRSLHGRRSIITGNLCFSLLISNGIILFGLGETKNKIACAAIAGILHFWLLSAFCWMLVEGYHLYRMVILVFQRGSTVPVKFYYLFAYGTPLIIVGISVIIRNDGYGGTKFCWISSDDKGLIWSFVGPACVIILVNIVIFILTLRSASSVKIKKEQSTMKKIKSWIRGSISVMCLLGLTWCIGLFYIDEKVLFISYIFTILNGLQGAFIFLFHILLNDKVSNFFSSKGKTTYGNKKFLNHTSSNQTHSKTSTRTSTNSLGCSSNTRLTDLRSTTSNHTVATSISAAVSNGKHETFEVGKYFRKKKVTHISLSNGLKSHASPYDANIRIRSASASSSASRTGPHGKHPYVSQKSSLTSL